VTCNWASISITCRFACRSRWVSGALDSDLKLSFRRQAGTPSALALSGSLVDQRCGGQGSFRRATAVSEASGVLLVGTLDPLGKVRDRPRVRRFARDSCAGQSAGNDQLDRFLQPGARGPRGCCARNKNSVTSLRRRVVAGRSEGHRRRPALARRVAWQAVQCERRRNRSELAESSIQQGWRCGRVRLRRGVCRLSQWIKVDAFFGQGRSARSGQREVVIDEVAARGASC
jgi:hypothetical protein